MIKVTVGYPYAEGARFDHDDDRDRRMPMVQARLSSACAYCNVDKGLANGSPRASVVKKLHKMIRNGVDEFVKSLHTGVHGLRRA